MTESKPTINADTISEIPLFRRSLSVTSLGSSPWAWAYRVDIKNDVGGDETYFMKVSIGDEGRNALYGEFESALEIYSVVDDFTPKPMLWGSFKEIPNYHYYICQFYKLSGGLPEEFDFCAKLAALHSRSRSPNGKFGSHVTTYNGDLPQENGYADTWKQFYISGFKHMLTINIDRGGPWEEMEGL
ncbi:hypothetical protein V494_02823 [Pseudogymnoascus sp. VKM F-4513 (FW-928)]|nr:hypothetical protein V494_02823 [Pseudogymnoascus sp. VKM F-4513 (FW-928)]